MACHASGGLLVTAVADAKILVWYLFSGYDDTTIRVWDLTTKKCVATLERHRSNVTSIAIANDG
ncbi:putative transcription factor WD40-like family [Helianthus annuus]|nr:putative transcription factor WD40-like family [Helianthus annuus]KAJ0553630.1 putative transcription factor WD40-like family [Helianthus annuus]KAJ0897992.1 putative transcription factor WD40-like family [Helianthus annuus]